MLVKKTPVVAVCLTFAVSFPVSIKAYQGFVWELRLSFTSSLAGSFQKKKFKIRSHTSSAGLVAIRRVFSITPYNPFTMGSRSGSASWDISL